MKAIKLILLFSLLSPLLSAQTLPEGFEVRLGLFNYKALTGLGGTAYYEKDWINYQELILAKSISSGKKWIKLGLGYLDNTSYRFSNPSYFSEDGVGNAFKVFLGIEQISRIKKTAELYYGFDLEFEQTNLEGNLFNDVPPYNQTINHQKRAINLEANLGLRKRVANLGLFIETNWVYRVAKNRQRTSDVFEPWPEVYQDSHYNPINLVGISYLLN